MGTKKDRGAGGRGRDKLIWPVLWGRAGFGPIFAAKFESVICPCLSGWGEGRSSEQGSGGT